MSVGDALLVVLALGVALLLGRGSHWLVAALLVASALAVSAVLFLPTAMLAGLVGMERVHGLYDLTRATPLDPPEWVHLIVFAWLGFLLWLARRDIRNWRGVALVAALGVAAELSQWLTDGRQPKVEDAALNVLGGLTGVLLGLVCCVVAARVRGASGESSG